MKVEIQICSSFVWCNWLWQNKFSMRIVTTRRNYCLWGSFIPSSLVYFFGYNLTGQYSRTIAQRSTETEESVTHTDTHTHTHTAISSFHSNCWIRKRHSLYSLSLSYTYTHTHTHTLIHRQIHHTLAIAKCVWIIAICETLGGENHLNFTPYFLLRNKIM